MKNTSFLKKYGLIFAIVLPVALLVVIRSLGTDHFRSDAVKLSAPSINQSNIITTDRLKSLTGKKLIISLSGQSASVAGSDSKSIAIPADSILSKESIKVIKGNDGPVILFSSDAALSARIWMVLAQMGFRNILILTDTGDGETLKYKFRPDTMEGPEL